MGGSYSGKEGESGYENFERVIYLIGKHGFGRRKLAEELGSTEMKTRMMIEKLAEDGIVEVTRKGCDLTPRGERIFKRLEGLIKGIKNIKLGKLSLDKACVGATIKKRLNSSWEVRDEAIRGQATGAIVLYNLNGNLVMPPSKTQLNQYREDYEIIKKELDLQNGETSILVFAPDRASALNALWRVLSSIVKGKL